MSPNRHTGERPQLLFKIKKGTVTAEIHGPRIGWRWRDIKYCRGTKCQKERTRWIKVASCRSVDRTFLEHCVKRLRAWLKDDDVTSHSRCG